METWLLEYHQFCQTMMVIRKEKKRQKKTSKKQSCGVEKEIYSGNLNF